MEAKYLIGSVAIAGIAGVECVALATGQDGAYISLAVGAISAICAGIVGFKIGTNKTN